MSAMRINVPDSPFARALVDGSVKVDGFEVSFEAPGFSSPAASARLRGAIEPELAGAEQVIPDYLLRLVRGVGQPLVAIPIFLTRGMAHGKYVGRRDGRAPGDLNGGRICMSRMLAASAVSLRGILAGSHGLKRGECTWFAGEQFSSDDSLGTEWPLLEKRLGINAPGLLDLLAEGEFDAVLYPGGGGGNLYEWVEPARTGTSASHYGDLESLVRERPGLELTLSAPETIREWFKSTSVYPLFHTMALHAEVNNANPALAGALVSAFARAAERGPDYMEPAERARYQKEIELLGVDPNVPGLTSLNRKSMQAMVDILDDDGVLPRRPTLEEIFPAAS